MKEHQKRPDAIAEVVASKIQQHLEQGHDIAFHLTFHENGDVDVTRTVQGEGAVQIRDIDLGGDSLTVDQVTMNEVLNDHLVVTPEAVATARTLLTSSLLAYEVTLEDEDKFVYAKVASHEKSTENSYELIETSEMGVFTENTTMYREETVSVKVETTKAFLLLWNHQNYHHHHWNRQIPFPNSLWSTIIGIFSWWAVLLSFLWNQVRWIQYAWHWT